MADDGVNLISDPGFEDLALTSYFLFTTSESKDANCRFTISPDTFHSGKQSALLQSDDFARFGVATGSSFPVTTGD